MSRPPRGGVLGTGTNRKAGGEWWRCNWTDQAGQVRWLHKKHLCCPGRSLRTNRHVPSPIRRPLRGVVVQGIATGPYHCVAVSSEGALYSWGGGAGAAAALGHGEVDFICAEPTRVEALRGRQVVAVAAGSQHSLCLVREVDREASPSESEHSAGK